jgi:hypothetical protein
MRRVCSQDRSARGFSWCVRRASGRSPVRAPPFSAAGGVFNEPYKSIVSGIERDDDPKLEIADSNLVKRYYNAAQLALVACEFVDFSQTNTSARIQAFKRAISTFASYDYFVLAALGCLAQPGAHNPKGRYGVKLRTIWPF